MTWMWRSQIVNGLSLPQSVLAPTICQTREFIYYAKIIIKGTVVRKSILVFLLSKTNFTLISMNMKESVRFILVQMEIYSITFIISTKKQRSMQANSQELRKQQEKSQCDSKQLSANQFRNAAKDSPAKCEQQAPLVKSEFYQKYKNYLKIDGNPQETSRSYEHNKKYQQRIQELLKKDKNISFYNKFVDRLQISIIRCVYDCLQIGVSWGFIYCEINMIRMGIDGRSIHGERVAGKGSFSTTYFTQHLKKTYITKSMPIAYKNNLQSIMESPELTRIITEYFISLLAGLLEIGPKTHRLFGFDIVLYNDCADYVIEVCEQLCEKTDRVEDVMEELKFGLRILHSLKICHCDIKPENVMYCARLGRVVFVDFGLARVIREQIGYKSLTYFVGTYMYSGEQMRKLYVNKIQNHIDMYYNDVQSVQLTLEQLQKQSQNANPFKSILQPEKPPSPHLKPPKLHPNTNPNNNHSHSQNSSDQQQRQQQQKWQNRNDLKLVMGELRETEINRTQHLINLLNIKYHMFNHDNKLVLELMQQEKVMVKSVMKILVEEYCQPTIRAIGLTELIQQTKNKLKKFTNRYHKFDYFIAEYLTKQYCDQRVVDVVEILKQTDRDSPKFKDGLLKVTRVLNPCNDPPDPEQCQTLQKTRQKMLTTIHETLHPDQQFYTTPQYKCHMSLRYLLSQCKKNQSQQCLINLRQAFIRIDDYISCLQVENQIIRMVGQTSLSWFYVIRVYFFVGRRRWLSSAYFYGDWQWFQEVRDKKVKEDQGKEISTEEVFQDMLRTMAMLILSSQLSQAGVKKYKQANHIIKTILSSHPVRTQLNEVLIQIQHWCNLVQQSFSKRCQQQLTMIIEQMHQKQLTNLQTLPTHRPHQSSSPLIPPIQSPPKTGYINELSQISKFYIQPGIVSEFTSILMRNQHQLQYRLIALYQIQRIVRSFSVTNLYTKVQMFRVYVQVGGKMGVGEICGRGKGRGRGSGMGLRNVVKVFVEGMREVLLLIQKHDCLKEYDISFYQQFKKDLTKFSTQLLQTLNTFNDPLNSLNDPLHDPNSHNQPLDKSLQILFQSYHKYITQNFFQFQKHLLHQCKALLVHDPKYTETDDYGMLALFRELKLLYQSLESREQLLRELVVQFFHRIVGNNRVNVMLSMPEAFQIVFSIQAQTNPNVVGYFNLLISLTKPINPTPNPSLINYPLQFMYRQSITRLLWSSTPAHLSHMLQNFVQKLSLLDIHQNYLYSIMVPYILATCLQVTVGVGAGVGVAVGFLLRKRMVLLGLVGIGRVRCRCLVEEVMGFLWREIRKMEAIVGRKNIRVLRNQIRIYNEESSNKLSSICLKNIRVTKNQLSLDFDIKLKEILQKKLNRLKNNIKSFDID